MRASVMCVRIVWCGILRTMEYMLTYINITLTHDATICRHGVPKTRPQRAIWRCIGVYPLPIVVYLARYRQVVDLEHANIRAIEHPC